MAEASLGTAFDMKQRHGFNQTHTGETGLRSKWEEWRKRGDDATERSASQTKNLQGFGLCGSQARQTGSQSRAPRLRKERRAQLSIADRVGSRGSGVHIYMRTARI